MKLRFLYRAWKARWRDQRLEIGAARALIRPGELVIDAGANKGAYLYWLRRCAGSSGTVLAYEPQPSLAHYLQQACAEFGWQNVEVHAIALSDRAGKSTLHVPGSGVSPGASLESSALDQMQGSRLECLIDTLDHQLREFPPLRFLKVDVEGHELALFRGATETLQKDHPALLFECEARHLTKHSMADVFGFLQNFGYRGYLLQERSLLPLDRFDPAIHQARTGERFWDAPTYFNNFLFTTGELPRSLQGLIAAP